MVRIKLEIVPHSQVSCNLLLEIAGFKNKVWEYSLQSQEEWIKRNLQPEDFHLIIRNEHDEIVGYTNIVKLNTNIDVQLFGIGNVSVSPNSRKAGIGFLLIKTIEYFLHSHHASGILLCKESLIGFYEKSGWHEFKGAVSICGEPLARNIYVFTDKASPYNQVELDRNF